MNVNYLFEEANKIVPFKKMLPFWVLLIIIGLVIIFTKVWNSKTPNQDFYKAELIGRVQNIQEQIGSTFFKIGAKWYLIKDECITHISVGDSIVKNRNSFHLMIFEEKSNIIKYQEEVKSLIFESAGSDNKPKL